jgi:uncharacterized membrane protein
VIKTFVAAVVLWPVLLASGLGARVFDRAPWLETVVYVAGGLICHQNPARSFHTRGAQWPVCGRCAGLYVLAPVGAIAALATRRRMARRRELRVLAIAAVPTVLTFVLEHGGLTGMSSAMRFAAALPLGAVAAWVMVRAVSGTATTIE